MLGYQGLPGDSCSNEELRPVGVFAGIGHAERTRLAVFQLEVLVWKLRTIDRLPSSAWSKGFSLWPT